MTEQDVRDGLHGAISGEPPLSFDPDALIATAHRQATRRRALVSAGVATALVAVAAVAVPIAIGRDAGPVADRPVASSEASSPPPVYESWPPKNVKPVTYTAHELGQRAKEMRTHLDSRLRELLPNAKNIDVGEFGGEAEGDIADGQTYLNTFVAFTIDQTRYGIGINVYAPGADVENPTEVCVTNYCEALDDVAGGQVLARTEDVGQGGRVRSVYHFRVSGTQVSAVAYNYDPTGKSAPVYAPNIPITDDQLAELATDPELNL